MNLGMVNSHSHLGVYLDLFHDWSLVVLMFISFFVFGVLVVFGVNSWSFNDLVEAKGLELLWTVLPGVVLMLLVVPSLYGLYLLDLSGVYSPQKTFSVVGRQWYWSYSYLLKLSKVSMGGGRLSYDSFMGVGTSLDFRNLDVDLPLLMVVGLLGRVLLSSSDVIHSFAVPKLGVKLDCVPGRLNQSYISVFHVGSFYGQCSEICGANHSFMPISVECIPDDLVLFK